MGILVQVADVRYAHGGNQIFDAVSFVVQDRARIALIGDNGSGKSTLFQLMARELRPQGGAVTHQRGLTLGYLHQHSSLDPRKPVRDIVAEAAGNPEALERELHDLEFQLTQPLDDDAMAIALDQHAAVLARLDDIESADSEAALAEVLRGLRFPEHRWQQRIADLSGGERKLVDVARFLLIQPEILLLDEPDNHLDIEAKSWLESWLTTRYEGAVCLITHDRFMIDQVAHQIFEIEDGRIREYPGNYTAHLELRQARIERELELRELAEREYRKLKESAEQLTQWARQNPKFATRAENQRRKMAEERARLDAEPVPVLQKRTIQVDFPTERGSTDVIEVTNVSKSFGSRSVLRPFDMLIRHGERVGLVGPNGSGKTTIVRMILGEEPSSIGTIRIGPSIKVGYFSQEHETLDLAATPLDTVRKVKAFSEQQALAFLSGLLFDRDDSINEVGRLSGGERARLQIALLVLSGANLLVLDEPSNNLDIRSVERLEAALLRYHGAILTISHDRYFLDKICTRIIETRDEIVRDYPGGYATYLRNPEIGTPLTRGMQLVMAGAIDRTSESRRAKPRKRG